MPSLPKTDDRFGFRLEIIEGGSGFFYGIIDEPNQGQAPSYQFNTARRLLRVNVESPIAVGSVIRNKTNAVFIVGRYGDSIDIFKSFRLFETTGKYLWQRRGKTTETITGLETDSGLQPVDTIWGAYEPAPEVFDRQIKTSFETARFITNRAVLRDDVIDGKRVTRVDRQLGLYILTLG